MPISQAPFFLRPHVRLQEFDLTERISADQSTTAFVGSEFRKGPLRPTYVSGSLDRFRDLYGRVSDPTLSFGYDTCQTFLGTSSNMLISRVVNGALYSAMDVFLDEDAVYGSRLLYLPHLIGTTDSFEESSQSPILLKLDTDLIVGNTVSLDITDGLTIQNVSVNFNSTHEQTMLDLALSIQATMNTFASGGSAYVRTEVGSSTDVSYTIVINSPADAILDFVNEAVAGGATQAVPTLNSDGWLFTIKAENPGVWANDIAVKMSDLDQGIRERHRLTFSAPLEAGNNFDLEINGVAITPVPFATDSDNTMQNIATEIINHPDIRHAYVETVAGAIDNDRSIVIVAKSPGPDTLTVSNPVLSGGPSQAIVVSNKTLDGVPSNGAFDLRVYDRSAPLVPLERWQVSTYEVINGFGSQIKFDGQINNDVSGSIYFRMVVNPSIQSEAGFAPILEKMSEAGFDFNSDVNIYMNGGDDGAAALTSHMVSNLEQINDRTKYPVSLLLNAGYTNITYQQALVSLCEDRNDCTAILDLPSDRQGTAQGARDYRLNDMNIDSSYAALYTPDVLISDVVTSELRYVPPSGHVAAVYAYNDSVAAKWAAPAGLNRGKIREIRDLRYEYTPRDQELLHPNGVNPIIDKPGNGPVVWGQRTMQYRESALSSVHIRRLLNLLETNIADNLEYTLWEANTEFTRFRAVQLCETILKPIHRRDGLYDYRVICDETNNTPDIIDADALAVDVYVKPVRAVLGIMLRAVIVRTGTSFSEIITRFNGTNSESAELAA